MTSRSVMRIAAEDFTYTEVTHKIFHGTKGYGYVKQCRVVQRSQLISAHISFRSEAASELMLHTA